MSRNIKADGNILNLKLPPPYREKVLIERAEFGDMTANTTVQRVLDAGFAALKLARAAERKARRKAKKR